MKYAKFIKEHLETNSDFTEDSILFIQKHLRSINDFTELAKKLGYKNKALAIGSDRLKKMINEPLLGLDYLNTYFDGTHGARSLVEALLYEIYPDEESRCKAKNSIEIIMSKLNEYTTYVITGKDGRQKRIVSGPEHRLISGECLGGDRSTWYL